MKNYSTEAYYAYARRMLEGEAGKANLPDKSDDPQFKKMIIGASAGGVGAVACIKYLDNVFSMRNLSDTIDKFTKYSNGVANNAAAVAAKQSGAIAPTLWQRIMGPIKGLIAKALSWVQRFCAKILRGFPELSKPIFGAGPKGPMTTPIIGSTVPTYGSVLCMALVGAAVGAVIYRIYKFVRNRRKKTESVAAFNARINREYKAVLVETVAFFDNLDKLTESDSILEWRRYKKPAAVPGGAMDATERMAQNAKDNAEYYKRLQAAKRAGIDAGEKARLAAADKVAAETPAKAEGFIASMRERLMTMWTSVKTWCSANPVLATMIGICAALVACWYGVKKYKESQAKKAATVQV